MKDKEVKRGEVRHVAEVLESVCKGCGVCVGACYSKAVDLKGFSERQILSQVETATMPITNS